MQYDSFNGSVNFKTTHSTLNDCVSLCDKHVKIILIKCLTVFQGTQIMSTKKNVYNENLSMVYGRYEIPLQISMSFTD